ncbi:MAG: MFS transporter [Chloroflexi bacterium HGW-Chloroflexi-2]|jgi:MFS family permease|nr:MAG: MFS transporter [Chloroflexi bacterium HGW-Chloroflexi-2]
MQQKLSYPKTFLLGFGFFGVSVIWSVYNAFVPLFLNGKFGLSAAWIGFFMTLDNIAAFLIQPSVGAYSDRLRTPIGRRMPFILIGAPIAAIAFGLIPIVSVLPLFVLCTSTLLISMALWRTPVIALMPDITPSRFRSQANGVINFMGGVGSIIAFLVGASLYEKNPNYPFWLGSALVIISSLLVFAFIREPKNIEVSQDQKPSLIHALAELIKEKEKSPLRILAAIFFWFVSYNAIEAFFTLYAVKHLLLPEADGARLLGQLSLIFVLMALPSGFIGAKFGRKRTIMTGVFIMGCAIFSMYVLPVDTLTVLFTKLPVVGNFYSVSIVLMIAGFSWALININSLPMVVDMTTDSHIGTFTGLYYLASTMAAILGPNLNGWIVQLSGNNYNLMMLFSPLFMLAAFIMMLGVKRGEAKKE